MRCFAVSHVPTWTVEKTSSEHPTLTERFDNQIIIKNGARGSKGKTMESKDEILNKSFLIKDVEGFIEHIENLMLLATRALPRVDAGRIRTHIRSAKTLEEINQRIKNLNKSELFKKENAFFDYEKAVRSWLNQEKLNKPEERVIKPEIIEAVQQEEETEPYFKIKTFNTPSIIHCNKNGKIYEHTVEIGDIDNSVGFQKKYSIYEGFKGVGNMPIFIITKNKVDVGDSVLYLKPMGEKSLRNYLEEIEYNFFFREFAPKKLYIKEKKEGVEGKGHRTRTEIISEIIDMHKKEFRFFELTNPVPIAELKNHSNFLKLATSILKDGTEEIDEALVYTTISHLPEVDANCINEQNYMPYSDNEIIVTEGGEGKSTLTEYLTNEPNTTEATIPNLLGSSDGKNKWDGKLQGRTKLLCLDENQDRIEEDVLGNLNNYMESGSVTRGKGIGIVIRGHAPLRFLGNPKQKIEHEEEQSNITNYGQYLMVKLWRDFLKKLSTNVFPFSRRVATVYFNLQLQKLRGKGINQEQRVKGRAILRTIAEAFKEEVAELFLDEDIRQWLNEPFDDEYIEKISGLANKCDDELVKKFIRGRAESHRHTKGQAVKLAWLETGLGYYLKHDELPIEEIISTSKQQLEVLKKINLHSMQNILEITSNEDIQFYFMERKLKTLPLYSKIVVYCLLQHLDETKEKQEPIITLEEVEKSFNTIKYILQLNNHPTYQYFHEVKRKLEGKKIDSLLAELGISFEREDNLFLLEKKFYKYMEVYIQDRNIKLKKLQTEQTEQTERENE